MADRDSRQGVRYANGPILDWADRAHTPADDGLQHAFTAPDREGMPAIQVGVSEGRFLHVLVRACRLERVVEVGTLAGYSAIHIASALPPTGHLWTIEFEPRHADVARANIERAGLSDRVTVVVGAGVEMLPTLVGEGPFDAMFVDADKESYNKYGQWAEQNLRSGGLLIGDNAYLFGKLLEDTPRGNAMREFHEHAARVFDCSVCLPTPDGLLVAVKR